MSDVNQTLEPVHCGCEHPPARRGHPDPSACLWREHGNVALEQKSQTKRKKEKGIGDASSVSSHERSHAATLNSGFCAGALATPSPAEGAAVARHAEPAEGASPLSVPEQQGRPCLNEAIRSRPFRKQMSRNEGDPK